MAYTTYGNPAANTLRIRLVARLDAMREAWAKWRHYRQTYAELNALSTRDLDDLGLNRSTIRSVAWEAAYGA